MLTRTVRMTFVPTKTDDFLALFDEVSQHIRSFDGCAHLELWQDVAYPNIFTTYSQWDTADHLQAYRNSNLFESTWRRTKAMFADRPVARSSTTVRLLGD